MSEFFIPTKEGWDAAQRAIAEAERQRNSRGQMGQEQPGTMPGFVVEVVGDPVQIITTSGTETTTPTTTTSTSSTSSTTGTTCALSATTGTTTTTAVSKRVYPGKIIYRQMSRITNEEWWFPGENCWIQEVNDLPLGKGCRLIGQMCGQFRGFAVICVKGDGTNNSCTQTTTTTTCACLGVCVWELTEDGEGDLYWFKTSDGCGGTTSSTGTTTTTTDPFNPPTPGNEEDGEEVWGERPAPPPQIVLPNPVPDDPNCYCDTPVFCPSDFETAECSITYTFCSRNQNPSPPPSYCTTSTSSTTGTTNTTSEDPCGSGCTCVAVPGYGWIRTSIDCSGDILPGGSHCSPCSCPLSIPVVCQTLVIPCPRVSPPPGCGGVCEWVWPDLPGYWWLCTNCIGACSSGVGGVCACDRPSAPGNNCGQQVTTNCHGPPPPGGSTSATSGTTTTTIHCHGWCEVRGNGSGGWVIVTDCGEDCDGCQEPIFNSIDECDILQVPCGADTTSSTSSTTTTTLDCPSSTCSWICVLGAVPTSEADSANRTTPPGYFWLSQTYCPDEGNSCYCPLPVIPCNATVLGFETDMYCEMQTSTTSATTTTTIANPCQVPFGGCVYQCLLDPRFGYQWQLCRAGCDPAQGCICCPSNEIPGFPCDTDACPACTSFREGQLCNRSCNCEQPSTTNTATTETAPPGGSTGAIYEDPNNAALYPAGIA